MKTIFTFLTQRRRTMAATILMAVLPQSYSQSTTYPNKPIRFFVPYSAGTTTDVIARIYAQKLSEVLGQNIIIDNKAGAGGNISAESTARAAPDGYTLTFSTSATHATNPALYGKVPFDPIKDFTHIALLVSAPNMLVINPKIPAQNLTELIGYAKVNPGKLTYISAGSGTSPHMCGELLKTMAGIDIRHVPYKNISQGFNDLLSGEVSMTFYHVPVIYQYVKSGRLRALGVATKDRSPIAPEVPPISDVVAGFDLRPWWGLSGPAGMPSDIVEKLYQASTLVMNDPVIREKMISQGMIVTPLSSKDFNDFALVELVKWTKLVRDSGARVD
ncbi:MAG: tripartite tricarboxylate transporter substrate binding protein [Limnohabitans sp.]|nr:tripartite tricarboxylate transporter substrate binding protein [Limnohabitans sp.]